jgi:hypothetical protein
MPFMIFYCALVGCAVSLALGLMIGHGRKISATERAALAVTASQCPNCNRPVRDEKGHFVKPGGVSSTP